MARRVGAESVAAQMQVAIGLALTEQGRLQEGVDAMREAMRAVERAFGPGAHPNVGRERVTWPTV